MSSIEVKGLAGKVALITGAARGQGRSHAVHLAEAGVDLILVDICAPIEGVPYDLATPDDLDATVDQVQALGRRAVAAIADVREFDQLKAAVDTGVEELGRLDIVLANAGVVVQELDVPGWELSEQRWRAVIEVNLMGAWHTLKAAVPKLLAGERGGSIVITSSTAGIKGMVDIADYAASKHGLVGLMRTFAQELAPHDIRVNTVHPTGVATPMIENEMMETVVAGSPALADNFANLLEVPSLQAADISEAILWLVSDAARFVTGVTLPVDAGFTQK
jgi:SDR family mycofactocin-dependent oxidoreductase